MAVVLSRPPRHRMPAGTSHSQPYATSVFRGSGPGGPAAGLELPCDISEITRAPPPVALETPGEGHAEGRRLAEETRDRVAVCAPA